MAAHSLGQRLATGCRLPLETHRRLAEYATSTNQSMNSAITTLIQNGLQSAAEKDEVSQDK